MLNLSSSAPFARGGKRECHVHPHDARKCIKVLLQGQEPAALRQRARFSKRFLRPVSFFDENHREARELQYLANRRDEHVWRHIPKLFGTVETDRGRGLVVELVRDHDGVISSSLLEMLRREGRTALLDAALREFTDYWLDANIPSRRLSLDNLVVCRRSADSARIHFIDGYGYPTFFQIQKMSGLLARSYSRQMVEQLRSDVAAGGF